MTNYLSIPIIDEFVKLVEENPNNDDHMEALLSGMLNHYFPLTSGYCVIPRTNRDDSHPNFTISRLQSRVPGERGVFDHVLVKVKGPSDTLEHSMGQLVSALEKSKTEHGRCWAVLVNGVNISFYKYRHGSSDNHRLLPWRPAGRSPNTFHIRDDCEIIDWVFNYMVQKTDLRHNDWHVDLRPSF